MLVYSVTDLTLGNKLNVIEGIFTHTILKPTIIHAPLTSLGFIKVYEYFNNIN